MYKVADGKGENSFVSNDALNAAATKKIISEANAEYLKNKAVKK